MNFSKIPDLISKLKENDAYSKKNLGQHFLVDLKALEIIVDAAEIEPEDTIIEVGPGMGVLSSKLLDKVRGGGRLIAFEFDSQMVELLNKDYPELEVVPGDVLNTAPKYLEEISDYKVVANIPYQISTPLLYLFMEGENKPGLMVLLVQKELGERICSGIGHKTRGYLSVLTEIFYETEVIGKVKPESFWPMPKVESVIIKLRRKKLDIIPIEEIKSFKKFVYNGFNQKRKQIKKLLSVRTGKELEIVVALLNECELKDTVRAEEISIENWYKLFKKLS